MTVAQSTLQDLNYVKMVLKYLSTAKYLAQYLRLFFHMHLKHMRSLCRVYSQLSIATRVYQGLGLLFFFFLS